MEFGVPFSFVFQDPDWIKKIGIMALVSLIPVVGQIVVLGWMLEVILRVINDDPTPLPSLDFGGQLGMGFKALVVGIGYSIPLFIIMLPLIVVAALGEPLDIDEDTLAMLMSIFGLCCGGLTFLLSLVVALLLPAALGNLVTEGSIGAAFRIGELFNMVKSNIGAFVIAVLGAWVASLVGSLGSIACGIGVLVTMVYAYAITGHFYAQAYKQGKANVQLSDSV
jgi:hypothetical protein